jgi:hypothetical protein
MSDFREVVSCLLPCLIVVILFSSCNSSHQPPAKKREENKKKKKEIFNSPKVCSNICTNPRVSCCCWQEMRNDRGSPPIGCFECRRRLEVCSSCGFFPAHFFQIYCNNTPDATVCRLCSTARCRVCRGILSCFL